MKKLVLILIALTVAIAGFSQVVDSTKVEMSVEDKMELLESDANTGVTVNLLKLVKVTTKGDSTLIEFKNRNMLIVAGEKREEISMIDKKSGERNLIYSEEDLDVIIDEIETSELEKLEKERITASLEREKQAMENDYEAMETEREASEFERDMEEVERDMEEIEKEFADESDEDSDWSDFDFDFKKDKNKDKFEGHWAGIEVGINNFVNSDYSMDYDPDWMNLNNSKSWNFNLNMAQQSVNIIKNRLGFVTGIGIEWNGYNFDGKSNIQKVGGQIVPDSTFANLSMKKNKFSTTYLTVPALLELHFSNDGDFYVTAGVIGGLKIGNSKKIVYYENGKKDKRKEKGDDLNLRSLRYGFVAKIGFDVVDIYARYYLNSLFENSNDPELYPFSIGLALNF